MQGEEGRRGGADLGCLVGLQGQEVGPPESLGSLAEGAEEGCLAEAGGRPKVSTGGGEKQSGDPRREGRAELAGPNHDPHHLLPRQDHLRGATGWVPKPQPQSHSC